MATSQNGYSANDVNVTSVRTIPGTERRIRLRNGSAGDLLTWVLAQFHRRVEDIDDGQLDDWGYAERPIRGSTTVLSNHASGTAADVNATKHPQGTSPSVNFSRSQIDEIHKIVGQTQGCVRWGGDYVPPAPKDGMHFEIVRDEAACARVLATLTSGEEDDDMQLSDNVRMWQGAAKATYTVEQCLASAVGWGEELGKRLAAANAGILAAIAASTKDPGITEARLEQIVNDAVAQHVQITGTVQIGPKGDPS